MEITLQYIDGCPNWKTAAAHLATLVDQGVDATITHALIDSHETAVACGFHGSPTVLIEGADPFGGEDTPVGLACRVYRTEDGYAGTPSLSQLRDAINEALDLSQRTAADQVRGDEDALPGG